MLPDRLEAHLKRVAAGQSSLVLLETADVVRATAEILDLVTRLHEAEPPSLYIVREDAMQRYNWTNRALDAMQRLPLPGSLDVIEGSRSEFAVFIVWNVERAMDDRDGQAAVRNFILQQVLFPAASRKLVVFIEPIGAVYPPIVTPYVSSYVIPYPSLDELLPMVRRHLRLAGHQTEPAVGRRVASALLGLAYSQAEQVLQVELVDETQDLDSILASLNARKQDLLVRSLGMTFLSGADTEPAGYEYLLRDFEIHRESICIPGRDRQKGWLLVGEPGTGKTLIANALATKLGYPAVQFDISAILDSLVGQSEKNARRAVTVLETCSPAIVFLDEIEKALSGTGELDGGVMRRTIAILLEFLAGTQAPLFVLGAANSMPDNPALVRKGRFDRIYWVDRPSYEARRQIFESCFRVRSVPVPETVIDNAASQTRWFSGADVTGIANETVTISCHMGIPPSEPSFEKILLEEIERERPRVDAERNQHARLREWGRSSFRAAGRGPEE